MEKRIHLNIHVSNDGTKCLTKCRFFDGGSSGWSADKGSIVGQCYLTPEKPETLYGGDGMKPFRTRTCLRLAH
jgi:hypothetical protein